MKGQDDAELPRLYSKQSSKTSLKGSVAFIQAAKH
jgi:hypothetical protein